MTSSSGALDRIGSGHKVWSSIASGKNNTRGSEPLNESDYSIPQETPIILIAPVPVREKR